MVPKVAFEQNQASCSGSHEGQKKNGDEQLYARGVPWDAAASAGARSMKEASCCNLLAEFQFDSHHDAHIFL